MTLAATFDERYRAISARDTRFDGQFVTAVRTTRIYCKPSCPARTPHPQNVSFYPTAAAAHEAGYRACLRCIPDAAPGSPDWDVRGDVAARAMRLIADGVIEREGVSGLAARLGYSSRHLSRILHAQLGASPLALARAHRAHNARLLVVGTDLSFADVAFSAGFGSVRQFNDTMRSVFSIAPTELRNRRAVPTATHAGSIRLNLPVREPYDVEGVMQWMRAREISGMERAQSTSFERTLRMPHGSAWFRIERLRPGALTLTVRVQALADLPVVIARVRRLFDMDADPEAIDAALRQRPELVGCVEEVPGIRVLGTADPHEMLLRTMIGQQISVAAARTHLERLVWELGEETTIAPEGGPTMLFPAMRAIADHGAEVLRGPKARIAAIVEAATKIADGEFELTYGDDRAQQRSQLLALRGVGPWTADYVRMRVLGDPDVFLPTDVAVQAGARALEIPDAPAALTAWAEASAPWRSYLTAHLWRAVAPPSQPPMSHREGVQ